MNVLIFVQMKLLPIFNRAFTVIKKFCKVQKDSSYLQIMSHALNFVNM